MRVTRLTGSREVERIAREVVPGGGAVRVSLLSAGLLHDTYRVDRDGRAFSMRLAAAVPRAARLASAKDAAWVLRVLRLAADRSLAPPLVYSDAQRGIGVQEWVQGRAWSGAAARTGRNIERFALLLRQVHALPAPLPSRSSGPASWIHTYSAALRRGKRTAKHAAKHAAVPPLAAAAARQLARLEALPQARSVVCHSDLHRLNVVDHPLPHARVGSLLLLDWEYAHVSEPFWDLAGWSTNNDFPDGLLRRLLAAYLCREPRPADWTRCKLLCWLYDYICLLWSELYLRSRRSAAASDVQPRAAVLRDRLSLDVGDSENFRHTTLPSGKCNH